LENNAIKVITSKEAQNSFGSFLDSVQREPVVITRRERPVGVMISMDNLPAIFDLAESIKKTIEAGIKAGLEDSKIGLGKESTDEYIAELKQELQVRIDAKQSI
jgi:prevent-host-death family protein